MSLSIPNRLGLFFLESTLYPGEKKFLHVFEKRYRKLVDNCLASHGLFVIVWEDDDKVKEIGCIARVKRVLARYEGGELDIEVEGIRRVKVYMIDEAAFYRQGYLDPYNDTVEAGASPEGERLIAQHIKLLEIIGANHQSPVLSVQSSLIVAHWTQLRPIASSASGIYLKCEVKRIV